MSMILTSVKTVPSPSHVQLYELNFGISGRLADDPGPRGVARIFRKEMLRADDVEFHRIDLPVKPAQDGAARMIALIRSEYSRPVVALIGAEFVWSANLIPELDHAPSDDEINRIAFELSSRSRSWEWARWRWVNTVDMIRRLTTDWDRAIDHRLRRLIKDELNRMLNIEMALESAFPGIQDSSR